jgi:uncharacterized protein YdbL (DUF1318 family)
MPMLRRSLFPILAALALLAVLPGPALAKSLDQYRAEGVIAERFDGFVELRAQNAPAEAREIVSQVNAKRRQLYEQRAKEQNVSADAVGKVYAQQIVESAPAGTYFKQPSGAYTRK